MEINNTRGAIDFEKHKFTLAGVLIVLVAAAIGIPKLLSANREAACEDVKYSMSKVAIAQGVLHEEVGHFAPDIETLRRESPYASSMEIKGGVEVIITSVTKKQEKTLVNKNPTEASYTAQATHPSCVDDAGNLKVLIFDTTRGGMQTW